MKFNELQLTSHKNRKRVGRGISAGQGKTAGRGTKGQLSRTGKGRRPGFEGGQNPLMLRLPKLRGFTAIRPKSNTVYTGQLDQFGSKVIDNFILSEAGLLASPHTYVKLICKGAVTKKVQVRLQSASINAIAAIQKAGGTFKINPRVARPSRKTKPKKEA